MPRRNPAREPARKGKFSRPQGGVEDIAARVLGPQELQREGWIVKRSVREDREYTCPWCHGRIMPGVSHVVAYRTGRLEERRHYHTGCWTKEAAGAGR